MIEGIIMAVPPPLCMYIIVRREGGEMDESIVVRSDGAESEELVILDPNHVSP